MLHTIGNPSDHTVSSSPATPGQGLKYGAGRMIQAGPNLIVYVNTNPTAMNLLGAIAGVGTLTVGILSFLNFFSAFRNPLTYTLNIFYIFIGAVILATSLFGGSSLAQTIYGQANFMANPLGRGILYLYLGCVMTASAASGKLSFLYLGVGIYLLVLSLLSLVVTWKQRQV